MAAFNIQQLFKNAFGIDPPPNFSLEKAVPVDQYSELGQPYFSDDDLGRQMFLPVFINGMLLPFAVIGIDSKKIVVETPMPERRGTVIEIVSTEGYQITLRGILITEDNNYPESDLIDLEQIWTKQESVTLRSALTDIFLKGDYDHKVVITRFHLPPYPGVEHAKPYELEMITDSIFELELI